MKISKILLLTLVTVSAVSCNDWLKIEPITQRSQDEMFSSQGGFEDALIGCYIEMIDSYVYGNLLTFNMIEHLAWSYTAAAGSTAADFNYQNWESISIKTTTDAVFAQLYNIIASCNSILDHIDDRKNVFFTDGAYEVIKGEALAIRAYCHFDLLRLWGPVPLLANDNALVLPYVTTLSFKTTPYSTYRDFYNNVVDDLIEAAGLLSAADPIIGDKNYSDDFFIGRKYRMNYYAVKGLQARVYMWDDNRVEALACALEVIEAENPVSDKIPKEKLFVLGDNVDLTFGDLTLSEEHLFALYIFNLSSTYDLYFGNASLYRGKTISESILPDLYENHASDMRSPSLGHWWKVISTGASSENNYLICNKYSSSASPNSIIPLIRLAEIYLIAAEAHSDAEFEEGLPYFNTYLASRGVSLSNSSRSSLIMNLKKQYRKEFYAEGLMWYVLKRFNSPRTDFIWADYASYVPNYVIPLPATEPFKN